MRGLNRSISLSTQVHHNAGRLLLVLLLLQHECLLSRPLLFNNLLMGHVHLLYAVANALLLFLHFVKQSALFFLFAVLFSYFKAHCFLPWNPSVILVLQLLVNISLDSRVVRTGLGVQVHDVVDVLPQIVVVLNVSLETALLLLLKDESLEVANITHIVHVLFVLFLLVSQRGKRVNDDSEDDVEANDIVDDLEEEIVRELKEVKLRVLFKVDPHAHITCTSSEPDCFVHIGDVALEHALAVVLADCVRVK